MEEIITKICEINFLGWVTIIGTILTAIGTGVTLWQANKIEKYKTRIAFDLRKIHISEISEYLKRAQDEGRKLVSTHNTRGKKESDATDSIQSYIDRSLNLLPLNGNDQDIREKITNVQSKLRDFQNALPDDKPENASAMHTTIQESVSLCRQRLTNLDQEEQK